MQPICVCEAGHIFCYVCIIDLYILPEQVVRLAMKQNKNTIIIEKRDTDTNRHIDRLTHANSSTTLSPFSLILSLSLKIAQMIFSWDIRTYFVLPYIISHRNVPELSYSGVVHVIDLNASMHQKLYRHRSSTKLLTEITPMANKYQKKKSTTPTIERRASVCPILVWKWSF